MNLNREIKNKLSHPVNEGSMTIKHSAKLGRPDIYNRLFSKAKSASTNIKQNVPSTGSMVAKGTKSFTRGLNKLKNF